MDRLQPADQMPISICRRQSTKTICIYGVLTERTFRNIWNHSAISPSTMRHATGGLLIAVTALHCFPSQLILGSRAAFSLACEANCFVVLYIASCVWRRSMCCHSRWSLEAKWKSLARGSDNMTLVWPQRCFSSKWCAWDFCCPSCPSMISSRGSLFLFLPGFV